MGSLIEPAPNAEHNGARQTADGSGALQAAARDQGERTLVHLLSAMKLRGITRISQQYSGYGDEGSFEPPIIDDGVATKAEAEALEAYFETRLADEYPGWELNEGSSGEFVIELGSDEVAVEQEHTTRHSETDVLRRTLAGAAASAPPTS